MSKVVSDKRKLYKTTNTEAEPTPKKQKLSESVPPLKKGENSTKAETQISFKSLGLNESLCEACEKMGWKYPTEIQREVIPIALQGKDLIAVAQTGSGKTGAYALPILEELLKEQTLNFACILVPTRELATQVKEHFEALGLTFSLYTQYFYY